MKDSIDVLIVDDDASVLGVLEYILKIKGCSVATARDGEEALGYLEKRSFSLLISDIVMPVMDGFALLEAAKRQYPDMAVIMMTGKGDVEMVRKATLLGADEYISKPFKSEELSLVIERIFWKKLSKDAPVAKP